MNKLLDISNDELELIVKNVADKLGISKAIVEKDLWVCIVLKYLFSSFKYSNFIVFKGGTSLSKVYKLIERFSEDIDLALDWKVLGYDEYEPYKNRSNTMQSKFNNKLNDDTKKFLYNEVLPCLKKDFKEILKNKTYSFYIDETDGQTICFDYPKNHKDSSILQIIRLEIGCLAEPIPAGKHKIKSFIEEKYPEIFNENTEVVAVDSLRTFYEKITILHREANRINGNYPPRYSRHFYDVYKMIQTDIRKAGFENIDLLQKVIDFKNKFYTSNWAKYTEIMSGNLKLIPPQEGIKIFSEDYEKMKNMLFGEKISFNKILIALEEYQNDWNKFIKKLSF